MGGMSQENGAFLRNCNLIVRWKQWGVAEGGHGADTCTSAFLMRTLWPGGKPSDLFQVSGLEVGAPPPSPPVNQLCPRRCDSEMNLLELSLPAPSVNPPGSP